MADSKSGDHLAITLGVEEEFFLVDPATRDLQPDPDPVIYEYCERSRGPHKVVPEFLRSQIETNTRVCHSVRDVRMALEETRRLIINAAEANGLQAMAASTHPFAAWRTQVVTRNPRYREFAMTYQQPVRELLVGGMHIHAGFGDADSRIRIMTAMRRHLPLFHALSGSSPFSGGNETGFKSYRLTIFGGLPRTGLPGPLRSWSDFEALVASYQSMNFISGSSELWWDIRPSTKYGTLELRICDICQRLEEAVCIVALFASLVRHLMRLDMEGSLPEEPPTEIIAENRWLAARYGVLSFLGNTATGDRMDIDDYAASLVEELGADARALDCETELRGVLDIVRDGAGADRQVDHFRLRKLEGDSERAALRSVVDLVVAETRESVDGLSPA